MTSDPNATGGVSATLKLPESERYKQNGPWLVFHGSVERVREDIISALGLEVDADVPLADVVIEGQVQFEAHASVVRGTGGGRTVGGGSSSSQRSKSAETGTETPAEPEGDPLLAEIEAADSTKALQIVFADNKAKFTPGSEYLAALEARSKALKAA